MEQELVSIVIPTFRRNIMLDRAIRSALAQTYEAIEVIVVDDNGNGTAECQYVQSLVKSIDDERLRLVCNKVNLGGAEARNVGIEQSRGSYVAFLDDDDEYLPTKIEKSIKKFNESRSKSLALVYSLAISVFDDGSTYLNEGVFEGWCPDKLLETRCIAATSQWVCRKEALGKVGGFTKTPAKQDSVLMMKLFNNGYSIACIQEPLSLYYEHGGSRISNAGRTLEGERILQELGRAMYYRLDQESVKRCESGYDIRKALLYYSNRRYSSCFRLLLRALRRGGLSVWDKGIIPILRLTKDNLKAH